MQQTRTRTCLAQPSSISSLNVPYARSRLGRRPSGGSLVSLMLFCSRLMGRPRSSAGGGSADRNSLGAARQRWGRRVVCNG
jgi:hypothetical protein